MTTSVRVSGTWRDNLDPALRRWQHWLPLLLMIAVGLLALMLDERRLPVTLPAWAYGHIRDTLAVPFYVVTFWSVSPDFPLWRNIRDSLGVAFLIEVLQGFGLFPGTFDWWDFVCYLLGAVLVLGFVAAGWAVANPLDDLSIDNCHR